MYLNSEALGIEFFFYVRLIRFPIAITFDLGQEGQTEISQFVSQVFSYPVSASSKELYCTGMQ